jgi:CelD/BcsL family acetyltransferase involved in cellulose biosynthesis
VIHVELLRPGGEPAYEHYLSRRPEATLYQSTRYKRLLRDLLGCEDATLVASEGGEVRGVFPLMEKTAALGRVYNSLPYYGSNGGPLADSDAALAALVAAYNDVVSSSGVLASTTIANPLADHGDLAVAHELDDVRIGHWTPLSFEADHRARLLALLEGSARRNISKAERSGVTVRVDRTQMQELQRLHAENFRAIGAAPKEPRFFDLVEQLFEPGEGYELYTAWVDDRLAAALLVFFYNGIVEYYCPAIESEFRSLQPLSAILIEALTAASERGFRWCNWGGTQESQVNIYRFKRKWGGLERRYRYYTHVNDDAVLDLTPAELGAAFPNFYVVPYSALRPS